MVNHLTVVCVNIGNYLGRGEEYVAKLRSMVSRHLKIRHEFLCMMRSNYPGWWSKVELFKPGRFTGRMLYIDLDSVIVGPLEPIVESRGILHLTQWGWKKHSYGSGVMVWDAGEHTEIYEKFTPEVMKRLRGDQDWMTELGGWDALPFPRCCSYRYHARQRPPTGASIVSMHGIPKPHELVNGWVPEEWR